MRTADDVDPRLETIPMRMESCMKLAAIPPAIALVGSSLIRWYGWDAFAMFGPMLWIVGLCTFCFAMHFGSRRGSFQLAEAGAWFLAMAGTSCGCIWLVYAIAGAPSGP